MLRKKFYMIVISIIWSFIWYITLAFFAVFKQWRNIFSAYPFFEWRHITSQIKENAQMTIFPCQHQMHSTATVLNYYGESA